MKKSPQFLFVAFILLFLNDTFAQNATYKIEFISNWSSTAHPNDYPTSLASWSPLIGVTHKTNITFFGIGQLASDGFEEHAEEGRIAVFTQEINTSIANGNAHEVINGLGLSSGLGTITIDNINVDLNFPYISLSTMIAPSPDWVAQINSLKLTDVSNNWIASISVDVYATDAGTDSGTTYMSANSDTNPANNISSLENTFPFSDQFVGTYIFTLQQVLAIENHELQNSISIYPNPSKGEIFINNSGESILKRGVIYSITGEKVKEFNNIVNQKSLNFNSLKSGLYFLKLNSDKGNITKKIIIQ